MPAVSKRSPGTQGTGGVLTPIPHSDGSGRLIAAPHTHLASCPSIRQFWVQQPTPKRPQMASLCWLCWRSFDVLFDQGNVPSAGGSHCWGSPVGLGSPANGDHLAPLKRRPIWGESQGSQSAGSQPLGCHAVCLTYRSFRANVPLAAVSRLVVPARSAKQKPLGMKK